MFIRNKYAIETIAFVSYVLFAMAWVGGTANMDKIMAAMQIESLAKASLLSGAITIAKIVGATIAAIVALKLGIKAAFFASAILVAAGLVSPYAANYEILLASRFVMGIGGALMVVYLNPIVLKWFNPSERPIVNGLNAVAFNVGSAIVLWFVVDINALLGGWQNSLIAFSLASAALSALWLLVDYSDDSKEKKAGSSDGSAPVVQEYGYKQGLRDSFNWRLGLAYSGILALYLCLITFSGPAGITATKYVMGFGIIGSLAGMIYSQRFPKRIPILRWSGFGIVLATAGLLFGSSALMQNISGMALGFLFFLPIAGLVTLPQELPGMTGQRLTVIFSMFYAISYTFGTAILWVFGRVVDMNDGNFEVTFILMVIISSTFFFGSFFLPETGKVDEKEEVTDAVPEAS